MLWIVGRKHQFTTRRKVLRHTPCWKTQEWNIFTLQWISFSQIEELNCIVSSSNMVHVARLSDFSGTWSSSHWTQCFYLLPLGSCWLHYPFPGARGFLSPRREKRERSDGRKPLVAHDAKLAITHRCQLYNTKSINKQPIALHTCQVTTANQSMLWGSYNQEAGSDLDP